MKDQFKQEIRLNKNYSHLYSSDFKDDDASGDATPMIKRKTLFTEDYIKRFNIGNFDGGVIPPNCRYIENLDKGSIVVIEEPPALRTIKLNMDLLPEYEKLDKKGLLTQYGYKMKTFTDKTKYQHNLSLAFPYVIFILYINDYFECRMGKVFVRPAQMSGISDYICTIPLTNINDSQIVCFGDDGGKKQRSLNAAIQHIIMVFWSAGFNTDYTYNYLAYKQTPILNTYLEWQYMSQHNPMFIYNAEWIKYNDIKGEINYMKESLNVTSKATMGYKELSEVFNTSYDSGVEVKSSARGRRKHKLYYDICQSVYLNATMYMSVGDTIQMNNGEYAFIDSFAGFMEGGDIKYILMDYKGHKFHIKYHKRAIYFLEKNLQKQRRAQEAILKNGTVVKPGDILSMKFEGGESYMKINYIRRSRGVSDNIYELRMDDSFYLANNIDAELFDVKNPVISGYEIKKGAEYIIVRDRRYDIPMRKVGSYKFNCIDLGSDNRIYVNFECTNIYSDHQYYKIPLNSQEENFIIKKDECKPMEPVFRVGRNIYCIRRTDEGEGFVTKGTYVWNINGNVHYDNAEGHLQISKTLNASILKSLIKDDSFCLDGADYYTKFDVGDKVVVAAWETPLDTLNIKTIIGFKYDESKLKISFILTDKNEKISEELYVNGATGFVMAGKIRKVATSYEGLTVGTKIIAKKGGITAFPKKDVNIVVAIIIDSPHEPLVLCSNGCTLWYSNVIKNFDHISIKSSAWTKRDHVPLNSSKIKFQAGDIINSIRNNYYTEEGLILMYNNNSNTMKVMPLSYYSNRHDYSYTFDKYVASDAIFDCIPNPRIGPTKQIELGKVPAFYDFHGGLIKSVKSKYSRYHFINERKEGE